MLWTFIQQVPGSNLT